MNDRELEELMKNIIDSDEIDDVEIPESLQPDNVVNMLKTTEQKKKNTYITKYLGAAAAAAVVIGITGYGISNLMAPAEANKNEVNSGNVAFDDASIIDEDENNNAIKYKVAKSEEEIINAFSQDNAGSQDEDSVMDENMEMDASDGNNFLGATNANSAVSDGKYIYMVQTSSNIVVADIQDGKLEKATEISSEIYGLDVIYDLCAEDGRLLVSGVKYSDNNQASVAVINTQDINNIYLEGTVSQSGEYEAFNVQDGIVYLVSMQYFYGDSQYEVIPSVNGAKIDYTNFYFADKGNVNQQTVVSSFYADNSNEVISSSVLCSKNSRVFMNGDEISLYNLIGEGDNLYTSIGHCELVYGQLEFVDFENVEGNVENLGADNEFIAGTNADSTEFYKSYFWDEKNQLLGFARDVYANEEVGYVHTYQIYLKEGSEYGCIFEEQTDGFANGLVVDGRLFICSDGDSTNILEYSLEGLNKIASLQM